MSVFHITSNLFFSDYDLPSGFSKIQLKLTLIKVTIIHTFVLSTTRDELPVYSLCVMFVTS